MLLKIILVSKYNSTKILLAKVTLCCNTTYWYFLIVYFDVSDDCHTMDFSFGQNALGVTAAVTNRRFSIHTSLIPCSSPNKAPTGCLQWFTGTSGVGLVTTFNYAGGEHLADQVQTICFRYIQLVVEKI